MPDLKTPIYQMIVKDILTKINEGVYAPGMKLPSENQMEKIYDTSVPTVRRALTDLVYQGEINRIKGKGTFVTNKHEITEEDTVKNQDKNLCFLISSDSSDSSIMKMIRGAQKHLFKEGYSMTILCGEDRAESEEDLVQDCIGNNVDGVIWFSGDPEENEEGLRLLNKKNIPVVMLDRGPTQIPYTLVSAYNTDGGYQMAKYLIEIGHRRIAFAADRTHMVAEKDRISGYEMALVEEGIPYDESLVLPNCFDNQEKLLKIIKQHKITAIQCVNDKVALQVMRRLEQEGYSIPGDISIGGFDNADEAEYSRPRITTINQPFEEMGQVAADKLLQLLNDKPLHSRTYLPVELVVKESTAELIEF